MKIYRDISAVTIPNPVATIGIFDGVHRAHQAIISQLNSVAKNIGGQSVIITLWPHPRIVLNKDADKLRLINTLDEKTGLLRDSGLDNLIILPFDKRMAGTGFAEFVSDVLVDKLHIKHLVVGFNHQFGKNREGNYTGLQQLAVNHGFNISRVEPVLTGNERISSSKIREYLISGKLHEANEMLGYRFVMEGSVVRGHEIGQKIGFPTANIKIPDPLKIIPGKGVYAVMVTLSSGRFAGMMNIGTRPTFNSNANETSIEVHLLDFEGDLYGQDIRVEFVSGIRPEKRFDSAEALKAQIMHDRELIKKLLEKHT